MKLFPVDSTFLSHKTYYFTTFSVDSNANEEEENIEPGHTTVIEVREDESLLPPDGGSELVLQLCSLDGEI